MVTTVNQKINHIFSLLEKLANGQELYPQDTSLQEELFGDNRELKDAIKANERSLRRYLKEIHQLYGHIVLTEKKTKEFADKKITIYRVSDKKDVSSVLKFFLEQRSDLTYVIQMLHEQDPSLFHELEADIKKTIEDELKDDKDIFLFSAKPFEILESQEQKKIFSNLKRAVKLHEYRTVFYYYNENIVYKDVKCLKMIYSENNWYVGVETDEELFKLLRIHFIKEVKYSKKNTYQKSVLQKYQSYFQRFENAMSLATQEPKTATLKVSSSIAVYFEEGMKPFFKSQKFIKKNADGSIEFSVSYTQPLEILPFIKQWLPEMVLQAPNDLREILKKELKKSISKLSN
jgi:predicted DNA-binding transcriptional regulator YafY